MIRKHQIELVRRSYKKLEPLSEETAAIFYAKLFELNPRLRLLFQVDMNEQGRKLMSMIGFAVSNLDKFEEFEPALQQLGIRHSRYGVTAGDYNNMGAALLWSLEKTLGDEFDKQLRHAWSAVYGALAYTMINASDQVA